jgi:hypothetical protein
MLLRTFAEHTRSNAAPKKAVLGSWSHMCSMHLWKGRTVEGGAVEGSTVEGSTAASAVGSTAVGLVEGGTVASAVEGTVADTT